MIIPTPTLVEKISYAKNLFLTTLKSNFKTRLRFSLKHLEKTGFGHTQLDHGNWSKGAGMYGGDRGKVGLVGKVRQRLDDDLGAGMGREAGGGGGGGGAGVAKGAVGNRGEYKRTTKGALAQHEALRKEMMKPTAVRDHMLGRKETAGVINKRAAFEKYNSEAEAKLKDNPAGLTEHRKSIEKAQNERVRFREQLADSLFQKTAQKIANSKVNAYLKRDAQDAIGQDRNSIRGNTFRNALNKAEGKANVSRERDKADGLTASQRRSEAKIASDQSVAQDRDLVLRTRTSLLRDKTSNLALNRVTQEMTKRIQADWAKHGKVISKNDAENILRRSIIESDWQPRFFTDNADMWRPSSH